MATKVSHQSYTHHIQVSYQSHASHARHGPFSCRSPSVTHHSHTKLLTVSWHSLDCSLVLYLANNFFAWLSGEFHETGIIMERDGAKLLWEWPVTGMRMACHWHENGTWRIVNVIKYGRRLSLPPRDCVDSLNNGSGIDIGLRSPIF